jgi:hypothetical protein
MKAPEDAPKNFTSYPVSFTPTVRVPPLANAPALSSAPSTQRLPAIVRDEVLNAPVIKSQVPLPIIKVQLAVEAHPAHFPIKTLSFPLVFANPALSPIYTFPSPPTTPYPTQAPIIMLPPPVVAAIPALLPTIILSLHRDTAPAEEPIKILLHPAAT